MFNFLPIINKSVTLGLFFFTEHISNHIIKKINILRFLFGFSFFDAFGNIIHIICIFNKSFRIIKIF